MTDTGGPAREVHLSASFCNTGDGLWRCLRERSHGGDCKRYPVRLSDGGQWAFDHDAYLAATYAKTVSAASVRVGDRLYMRDVLIEVIDGPTYSPDIFGRMMLTFLGRRLDTGLKGTIMFGPDGTVKRVEHSACTKCGATIEHCGGVNRLGWDCCEGCYHGEALAGRLARFGLSGSIKVGARPASECGDPGSGIGCVKDGCIHPPAA